MFIEIDDLRPEPLHVRHVYPKGELPFAHEDAFLEEVVSTDFVLTHRDLDLQLTGTIETEIRYTCSRCLKEFSRPLAASFDLFYAPQPKWSSSDDEIVLKYEDMRVAFYDGIRFDVNLMVLEQIELSMPMQPVCREDCKGLCYRCGADLNEGACRCKTETGDARLSVLLEYRKKK